MSSFWSQVMLIFFVFKKGSFYQKKNVQTINHVDHIMNTTSVIINTLKIKISSRIYIKYYLIFVSSLDY